MADPTSCRIDGLERLNPKRILCCQLRQIGDVLLLTPSIHMLKKHWPNAQIDVFTEKKCAPVLENNPEVNHVWALDRKMSVLESLRYYRTVGTGGGLGRYDLVIDFQQLPRIRWVMLFSDAPVKLSYPPPWYNQLVYTHWAKVSGPYAAKSKAGVLMNAFGLPWENDPPRIYLTDAEKDHARTELAAWGLAPGQTLVTVDATHRRITRLWPAEHYAALLTMAGKQRPDLRFLLLYGPGELEVAEQVRDKALAAGLDPAQLILPPRLTTLREMAAIQSQAALHLGNCSSPRHFAVAVGTKTLTVRGSTSSAWTYPGPGHEDLALGLPCQPCSENTCPLDRKCLTGLKPEVVLPKMLEMLAE
ncbi:MAG TPA: glycosyltransferase family 9 protein [Humidesulfovibrio sp.]|uniref:glycosyltransferase family 9 protein n=1 Tax=Humidesulfovibrio sp. TaxID=2910988 RepID=UPI002BE25627|nr:glycosyltransferase family 9 protein [Humidesulfovibrio sp.]HWR02778.1 glycosyltransferase family 9 protein [Humidesulfovibrio sp.]